MPVPSKYSFQEAVERRARAASEKVPEDTYGFEVDNPELIKNMDGYFKENAHVAGMVWGKGHNGSTPDDPISIVVNPHNVYMKTPAKRQALIKLEAARAYMDDNPVSDYPISPNLQMLRKQWFTEKDPYLNDDKAFRETLISRHLVGDLPKKLVTPEIEQETQRFRAILASKSNVKK